MQKAVRILAVFLLFFILPSYSVFSISEIEIEDEKEIQAGWSSVDDIFSKKEINQLVIKPNTGPIKIGFTVKEVREVMGVPDSIDEEGNIYYYRQSPIFFDNEWKVQSWDNRYGNLDVLKEAVKIAPGSHVSEVFKEKGFPIRITKNGYSYKLEYPNEIIYVSNRWNVKVIQYRNIVEYKQDRANMEIEEFLEEYNNYLKK
ncbi:MAG: hypothetical protein ACOC6D_05145 [Atribacterota bacterium]